MSESHSICSVPECQKKIHAKGMCNEHYSMWRLRGSTERKCYPVQIIDGFIKCRTCGASKPVAEFYKSHDKRWGTTQIKAECKACKKKRSAISTNRRLCKSGKPYTPADSVVCCECGSVGRQELCIKCRKLIIDARKAARVVRLLCGLIRKSLIPNKVETICVECGKPTGSYSNRYCGDNCAWRVNRRRRRARKWKALIEAVDLNEIAERDGWRCQLCGKKVRQDAPYKRRPTLDHIIPLSKGGLHCASNLQLAHFDCNSRKHDRMSGEQMRLW